MLLAIFPLFYTIPFVQELHVLDAAMIFSSLFFRLIF